MDMTRATVGALLLAAAMNAHAQDARPQVPAVVLEVQELLVAAYPELRAGRLSWRVTPTATGVVVEARPAPVTFDEAPGDALVVATVVHDEQGRLQELRSEGRLIAAARANVAGRAKYPPDDPDALATLLPAGLQARLGAPTVRERRFRADGSVDEAQTWHVELEPADGAPYRYVLVIEPVEGRLLSVVRR
jgi:hypothetical protein